MNCNSGYTSGCASLKTNRFKTEYVEEEPSCRGRCQSRQITTCSCDNTDRGCKVSSRRKYGDVVPTLIGAHLYLKCIQGVRYWEYLYKQSRQGLYLHLKNCRKTGYCYRNVYIVRREE